jgi:hypothetical protein
MRRAGWTLFQLGFTSIISLDNYGWWIEFTPAFFGAGMLSGINASWSFFGGTILAWGIIQPSLVKNGLAFGKQPYPDTFPQIWNYNSLTFKHVTDAVEHPSPRYWLLWPGVLVMLYAPLSPSRAHPFADAPRTACSRSARSSSRSGPCGSCSGART